MRPASCALVFLLLGAWNLQARMDRSRFNIGTYRFGKQLRDEIHVKELKEAGIDYVCSMWPGDDAEAFYRTLDLFEKYGIGCITETGVEIGAGVPVGNLHHGKMSEFNPLSLYEESAKTFRNHKAIWGLDVYDEPTALDMPHLGKVCETVRRLYPGQFPYVNLYPSYAQYAKTPAEVAKSSLGTTSYAEYLEIYCRTIPLDYISFDFYPFSAPEERGLIPLFYENLKLVSDACTRTGRSLWFIGQINNYTVHGAPSADNMRFQAYAAMAYGAEAMVWACWTRGWWDFNAYDDQGNRTAQYDKVKEVNQELHALGKYYMQFRHVNTHRTGFPDDTSPVSTGWYRGVAASDGAPIIIGEMVARKQSCPAHAVFIFAADDPYGRAPCNRSVRFATSCAKVVAVDGRGWTKLKQEKDGAYSVCIRSNCGLLLVGTEQ